MKQTTIVLMTLGLVTLPCSVGFSQEVAPPDQTVASIPNTGWRDAAQPNIPIDGISRQYARLRVRTMTGTISYNGRNGSYREDGHGRFAAFSEKIYALPARLQAAVDQWLQAAAAGQGATLKKSAATGPFLASLEGLTGGQTGYNKLSLSGPTYSATIEKSGHVSIFRYTCTIQFSANNIALSAVYEPYSGVVDPDPRNTSIQLNPNVSSSCSSALDYLPILGNLISRLVERQVNGALVGLINGFSAKLVQDIIPTAPNYLGLFELLPTVGYDPNAFGGFDAAGYIRNNFASLFTGRAVRLTLGVLNPPPTSRTDPTKEYISTPLTIDFSDSRLLLQLKLTDSRMYDWICSGSVNCPDE